MLFRKVKIIKPFGPKIKSAYPKISFCDLNDKICQLWAEKFKNIDQVEIVNDNIFKLKADGLISPANSFGDMGGGIDRLIDQYYNGRAQQLLRDEINREFFGELPVGMATILQMRTQNFGYLIAAPTMRVPGILRKESINVYLAMRAILVRVLRYNEQNESKILKMVIPGLGTGVGGMNYAESVNQMYEAYHNIYGNEWKQIVHSSMAPYVLRKE